MGMMFRGVRGAITVEENTAQAILEATGELFRAIIAANEIAEEDVASVMFTATPDLNAAFPAKAVRELGWTRVALMGMQEMEVSWGLPRCIRILIHWNTTKTLDEIQHIFLRDAVSLRPDLLPKESIISDRS